MSITKPRVQKPHWVTLFVVASRTGCNPSLTLPRLCVVIMWQPSTAKSRRKQLLTGRVTGIDWESLISHNVGIFSSFLIPLPGFKTNLQVTTAKRRRTSFSCTLQWCHCRGSLRRFLQELIDHVATVEWYTSKHFWSCDRRISMSIHFRKNRNRKLKSTLPHASALVLL